MSISFLATDAAPSPAPPCPQPFPTKSTAQMLRWDATGQVDGGTRGAGEGRWLSSTPPQTIHRGSISQPTEPCRGPLQTQCSGSCGSKQRDKTCICSEHIRSTSSTQEQSRAHALRMELPYGLCPIPSAVPISQGSDALCNLTSFSPAWLTPSLHSKSSSTSSDVHGSTEPSPTTLEASVQTAAPFPAGETEVQGCSGGSMQAAQQCPGDAAWHPALTAQTASQSTEELEQEAPANSWEHQGLTQTPPTPQLPTEPCISRPYSRL